MRGWTVLATAAAVGCVDEPGPEATCPNRLLGVSPRDGDDDVYYRADVRFRLAEPDPAATIRVRANDGSAVAGQHRSEGDAVVFTPDEPLAPRTAYTATLEHTCGEETVSFTTSATGSPLEVDVSGLTYDLGERVDLGAGFLLLWLSPRIPTADTLEMVAAYEFVAPYFRVSTPSLMFPTSTGELELRDVRISGAFAPDGSRIQGLDLRADSDVVQDLAVQGDMLRIDVPLVERTAEDVASDERCALP